MNKERLLKLATFLENLDPRKFNYAEIRIHYKDDRECGTLACAVGWLPECFPEHVSVVEEASKLGHPPFTISADVIGKGEFSSYENISLAERLFDITSEEADYLFVPGYGNGLRGTVPVKDVVALIRTFVEAESDIDNAITRFRQYQKTQTKKD